ncbi:hypothetical protein [Mycolicibacterium wolinskyi]|uniref:hypothetical protein n=1 Tax=Mycolicibacterium wolinskyi TaxID=59750 RepID=UPI003917AF65
MATDEVRKTSAWYAGRQFIGMSRGGKAVASRLDHQVRCRDARKVVAYVDCLREDHVVGEPSGTAFAVSSMSEATSSSVKLRSMPPPPP